MSIDTVYNTKILEYAGNIERIGRLDSPDGTAKAHSKLCGSTVIVDLSVKDGVVVDYAHDVKACALGQAAASILARHIVGCGYEDLVSVRDRMKAMLKDGGSPPEGSFSELKFLEPVRDYRARHASTLLAFEASVEAMENALSAGKSKGVA